MEKKIVVALALVLLVISSNTEGVKSQGISCDDSCTTGCVQRDLMEDESASYVHGGLAPVANVQNIAIDTKSPFYLHPSDHPGLIFVTQPLSENGENYFTWRRNMLTALQSKNKAGFVDGLIAKPDVHSGDFQSWIQCNAVVKSWIVNSLLENYKLALHMQTLQRKFGAILMNDLLRALHLECMT
ncbi:hypothetical protein RJ639_010897 [Escallonia herrerae]|uniref:Retrotransposon Copia-like N-terminal domain-containing protein n=1 Tax=Escallonia herrerae TaxID=1293975 RepID=A0AA88VQ11_9ASTE|nr:hypothetical protein RJ639_010897 [Escallonia herrerae]